VTMEVAMKTTTGHEIPVDRSKTLACVEILEQLGTELRRVSHHVCSRLARTRSKTAVSSSTSSSDNRSKK
jgi:hypothetical protein